jgi:hypothetical protein
MLLDAITEAGVIGTSGEKMNGRRDSADVPANYC